jgi:hypothetical protein
MPAVTSEAVARIEYDEDARILFVRFTSGEWYGYRDVPAPVARAFLAAGSKGRFFQERIRNRYDYEGPLPLDSG